MAIQIDAYGGSVNRYGEELCGNRVEVVRNGAGVTAILADGMGGGAKASILTSLAVKMMAALLAGGEPVGKIAEMIVESQPCGKEEGCGYSAFTIIQANDNGSIFIAQMETPDVILLCRGKPAKMEPRRETRQGRLLRMGTLDCREADTIVAVGSGLLRVGAGRNLKGGWQLDAVSAYMVNAYTPRITARQLVHLLLTASGFLAGGKPQDDLSALAFRVIRRN